MFLAFFSVGVLIYTFTNSACQIGPAICGSKRIGSYIGITLGIAAIIVAFYYSRKSNQSHELSRAGNKRNGLVILGPSLFFASIIMAVVGHNSEALNPSGAVMTPGIAMVISAVPIALAGIIVTGFGVYNLGNGKKSDGIIHPAVLSIFVIGIIAMLFLLFF